MGLAQREGEGEVEASTPMMRQYLEQKALHPDAILFFRLGDFYEMFFEDAVRASELLQITLTARAKGADRVPMCGVPYHAARRYIARLVEAGLRVAICEQVELPGAGPGIVRREVTRVISPGTVLDEEFLEPSGQCYLAAVHAAGSSAGAALLDASTGDFFCFEARTLEELAELLSPYRPRELLVPEGELGTGWAEVVSSAFATPPALARAETAAFEPQRAAAYLRNHFQVASLAAYGVEQAPSATAAAGAALRYVQQTQRTGAAHVDRLVKRERGDQLWLDAAALSHLEVLRTLRDGTRSNTLLSVLDRTVTAPGARQLARWLSAPLCSVPAIEARLDAVEVLTRDAERRERLQALLKPVGDPERSCGRLVLGAGNARDLRALGLSLSALAPLADALEGVEATQRAVELAGLRTPLRGVRDLAARLLEAVADEPPVGLKEGGLIRPGFRAELDALVALATHGKDVLLAIEQRERERTGIPSLKVRYNKVFGYYLEVTKPNLHLVPTDYVRKQTTVGSERFVTPELKEHEEQVLTAEERRCVLELELFEQLRGEVIAKASAIKAAAQAAATLDAFLSLARCAVEYGYVRPEVDDSGVLELVGSRHPVVERSLRGEPFVPNDVRLGGPESDAAQLIVITGPNMAGKSTVMRQVALCVVMAQAGSFVPADRARVGLCDRLFTRVGAADNLARGQSTFMVEMVETAHLLRHATPRSLVLLDEVGRGTSTFDGLSIAWAVAEHLHDQVRARAMFATHYHELTELARTQERVRNFSVAVSESRGRVVFLHKLVAGGASRSYGIEVARLAGLPAEVLARARAMLQTLESGEGPVGLRSAGAQLGLFASPAVAVPATTPDSDRLAGAVRALRVDQMTPLDALNWLSNWQKQLAGRNLAGPGEG